MSTLSPEDQARLQPLAAELSGIAGELAGNSEAALWRLDQVIQNFLLARYRSARDSAADAGSGVEAAWKVVGLSPDDAEDIASLSHRLALAGEPEGSLMWINRAMERSSSDPRFFRLRASLFEQLGRCREAERDIARAVQLSGNDPAIIEDQRRINSSYIHWLKDARDSAGDFSGEIEAAEEIIRRRPTDIGGYWGLAETLVTAGQPEEVLRCIERALALDGNAVRFIHLRATVLERLGRYREAEQAIDRALELAPDDSQLPAARDRIAARFNDYLRQESCDPDLLHAIEHAQELVLRCPESVEDMLTLADLLQRADRLEEALGLVGRVIELKPQVTDFHCLRAAVLARMGRSGEAEKAVVQAVFLCANSLGERSKLSQALKQAGLMPPLQQG
jgi:Flp pilus assembly protein TadD